MTDNFNRLGNCHNMYQGNTKKVLCVCSAGLLRSPTAANVLHAEYGYNTRAAGISKEFALILLDEVLVEWADEIVFMAKEHYDYAIEMYPQILDKDTKVLGVPDRYRYMATELQNLIIKYYKDYELE